MGQFIQNGVDVLKFRNDYGLALNESKFELLVKLLKGEAEEREFDAFGFLVVKLGPDEKEIAPLEYKDCEFFCLSE